MARLKIRKAEDLVGKCSPELASEINKVARKLKADLANVVYADWNYAEVDLFKGNDCIEWGYPVRV